MTWETFEQFWPFPPWATLFTWWSYANKGKLLLTWWNHDTNDSIYVFRKVQIGWTCVYVDSLGYACSLSLCTLAVLRHSFWYVRRPGLIRVCAAFQEILITYLLILFKTKLISNWKQIEVALVDIEWRKLTVNNFLFVLSSIRYK